jgi:DnaJ-class molecular chaperone
MQDSPSGSRRTAVEFRRERCEACSGTGSTKRVCHVLDVVSQLPKVVTFYATCPFCLGSGFVRVWV